jgi:hypothetical protein
VQLGACFEHGKKSAAIIVALSLALTISSFYVKTLNEATLLHQLGLLSIYAANPVLLAYAGYATAKYGKGDGRDAAASGVLAGLFAGLAILVIGIVAMLGNLEAQARAADLPQDVMLRYSLEWGMLGLVALAVEGAVFGLVGGFLANAGAKPRRNREKVE